MLKGLLPTVSGKGTDVILKGTGEMPFKKFEVGGNSYQETREGYNKAPLTAESQEIDGISFVVNPDGTFTAKGTVGANSHNLILTEFDFMPYLDKPITLDRGYTVNYNNNLGSIVTTLYDNSKNLLKSNVINIDNTVKSDHITSTINSEGLNISNGVKARMSLVLSSTYQGTTVDIAGYLQLVEGTETKPYEQYGAMPSPEFQSPIKAMGDNGSANNIISNENLLNIKKNGSNTGHGMTVTTDENGVVTLDGTAEDLFYISLTSLRMTSYASYTTWAPEVNVVKGKYKLISQKIEGEDADSVITLYCRDKATSSNFIKTIPHINNSKEVKTLDIDLSDTDKVLIFLVVQKDTTLNNAKFQFQLKPEQSSTEYIPHEEQNKTVPVQQPMLEGDYFDLDRGKEVHIWKKVDLSSVTTSQFYKNPPTGDDRPRWGTAYFVDAIPNSKLLCTHLKQVDGQETWDKIEGIAISPTTSTVYLYIDGVYDYTSLREALDKMILYYQSQTPTELDLTDEQKSALKEKLNSYEGTTCVFSEDEVSPIFDVEAYAKITNTSGQTNEIQSEPTSEPPAYEEPSMEENEVEEVE